MRAFILLALVATVIALGLSAGPSHKASRYGTSIGMSQALADDEVWPIKPKKDPCERVCLTSATGAKFCGFGTGVKGCNNIVLNNCIYTICTAY